MRTTVKRNKIYRKPTPHSRGRIVAAYGLLSEPKQSSFMSTSAAVWINSSALINDSCNSVITLKCMPIITAAIMIPVTSNSNQREQSTAVMSGLPDNPETDGRRPNYYRNILQRGFYYWQETARGRQTLIDSFDC